MTAAAMHLRQVAKSLVLVQGSIWFYSESRQDTDD